jgi:hypothetical protein
MRKILSQPERENPVYFVVGSISLARSPCNTIAAAVAGSLTMIPA